MEKEEETGKLKAINVTNVDGTPIVPPPRPPRRNRGNKKDEDTTTTDAAGAAATTETTPTEDAKENTTTTENGKGKKSKKAKGKKAETTSSTTSNGENPQKPPKEPPFHANFAPELTKAIEEDKGLLLANKTTVDVALGESTRIKLGQGGYAGIVLSSAVVGEGTYDCTDGGVVTFTWERALKYDDNSQWTSTDPAELIKTFALTDGTCVVRCVVSNE